MMDDNIQFNHVYDRTIATTGESKIPIKNHFILKRESARTQVTLDIYEIPHGALSKLPCNFSKRPKIPSSLLF